MYIQLYSIYVTCRVMVFQLDRCWMLWQKPWKKPPLSLFVWLRNTRKAKIVEWVSVDLGFWIWKMTYFTAHENYASSSLQQYTNWVWWIILPKFRQNASTHRRSTSRSCRCCCSTATTLTAGWESSKAPSYTSTSASRRSLNRRSRDCSKRSPTLVSDVSMCINRTMHCVFFQSHTSINTFSYCRQSSPCSIAHTRGNDVMLFFSVEF